MATTPKPVTTRALLISAGFPRPTPTIHHHVSTRLINVPKVGQAWEHVFRCARTAAERRWGLEQTTDEPDPESVEEES